MTRPSALAVARLLLGCGSARGSGCGSGCGCWSRGSAPASGNLAGYVVTSCNSKSTGVYWYVKIYDMIKKNSWRKRMNVNEVGKTVAPPFIPL